MKVIDVNSANFRSEVLDSDKPVIVDFNAEWCGPCNMLRPIVHQFAEEHDNIKVVSVDVDSEEELSMKYGVSSIPCIVVFKNGAEVSRSIGFKNKAQLESLFGGI